MGPSKNPVSNLPISLTPSSLPTDDLTSYFTEPVFIPTYLHSLLLSHLLLPKASNFSCTLNFILLPLLKDIPSVPPSFSFIFHVFCLCGIIPIGIHISVFSRILKDQTKLLSIPPPTNVPLLILLCSKIHKLFSLLFSSISLPILSEIHSSEIFFLHHSTNTGFAKDISDDRTANSSCLFSVHLLLGLSTVFVVIYHFHFLGMPSLLGVQDTAHS